MPRLPVPHNGIAYATLAAPGAAPEQATQVVGSGRAEAEVLVEVTRGTTAFARLAAT